MTDPFLSSDLVQNIIEFVSAEVALYLFPSVGLRLMKRRPDRFDYAWAAKLTHPQTRVRALLYLLELERVPRDDLLNYCAQYGNAHMLQRALTFLERISPLWNVWFTHKFVDLASQYGQTHILDSWLAQCKTRRLPFRFSEQALDQASMCGRVQVLRWWQTQYCTRKNLFLRYTKSAVDRAASPEVLDWWLSMHMSYDVDFKYSTRAIDYCQNVAVLDWWLNAHLVYGFRLKYTSLSIHRASATGNLDVLNWWTTRTPLTIALKYDESAMDSASAAGHVDVLNWWMDQWEHNQYTLRYSEHAIDLASANGHLDVLRWWFQRFKEGRVLFKRSVQAVRQASRHGHLSVLDWWIHVHCRHRIPFLHDAWAIEAALDQPHILEWWVQTCAKYSFPFQHIEWKNYRAL